MSKIIVLCGNDGVGKSTLVDLINSKNLGFTAVERSGKVKIPGLNISLIDELTLKYSWDITESLPAILPDGTHVYWVIIDLEISDIKKRIAKRESMDVWETDKYLFYFRRRFLELAARFGLPIIMNNTSPEETVLNILKLFEHNDEIYILHRLLSLWIFNPNDFDESDSSSEQKEFELIIEGESKKIYKVNAKIRSKCPMYNNLCFIVLKPTIYSHSKQSTGEIAGLEKIRATGTQLFLEMMNRSGLSHSYRCVNDNGVILSEFIENVPPTEIVVKKYCLGTDKHSYYKLTQNGNVVISETGEYLNGPYVRFDWRNPNFIHKSTGKDVREDIPNYYQTEAHRGKDHFYQYTLKADPDTVPMGDKTISEDLLDQVIDVDTTRKNAIIMFLTIQSYLQQVGIEIMDTCFMLNKDGTVFWSEINQDCMRIRDVSTDAHFDKDLWRNGGSSAADNIKLKWSVFNQRLHTYFATNPFTKENPFRYLYQSQAQKLLDDPRLKIGPKYLQIYKNMLMNYKKRRVIVTMDLYNGQPVLVESGTVKTVHSNGKIDEALNTIRLFPDLLVVDLNGAFGEKETVNRGIIKDLAKRTYCHSGGGVRTIQDVQDLLSSSVRRITVSSNTDPLFLHQIPKDRLIVELSINEKDEVLIEGRTVNTQTNVISRMTDLCKLGVNTFSITFHHSEGKLSGLPREQIIALMTKVPKAVSTIYIAGGITTLDDLEFLWSFDKIIPQLGSAIWKGKIKPSQIFSGMIRPNKDGLTPAVIQETNGMVKGLVYIDRTAIDKICETGLLHRYARSQKSMSLKGSTSGNTQYVLKISTDCESNSFLITVSSEAPFCHTGNFSCYSQQTIAKTSLAILTDHIKSRRGEASYSGQMQRNPGHVLTKIFEECWEVIAIHNKTNRKDLYIHECSDILFHLIMFFNSMNIPLNDILNELNARRWDPKLITHKSSSSNDNRMVLGITSEKYSEKTDRFITEHLGIQVKRGQGRSLKITSEIVDQSKYDQYFKGKTISFVTCRPKDMCQMITNGRIDGAITYNTVTENFPRTYKEVIVVPDPGVQLCLLKRKGDNLDMNRSQKMLVATEHVTHVTDFLIDHGFNIEKFKLDHVVGSSEGYMINDSKVHYDLCDAVVETGSTLEANNLEVWQVVLPKGQIKVGLYMSAKND